eukprot:5216966-Amphidinium_carterae.1
MSRRVTKLNSNCKPWQQRNTRNDQDLYLPMFNQITTCHIFTITPYLFGSMIKGEEVRRTTKLLAIVLTASARKMKLACRFSANV